MKQPWDVSVIQAGEKIRGPPRVPTTTELKFYETYLKEANKESDKKKTSQIKDVEERKEEKNIGERKEIKDEAELYLPEKNALILGATPELRDLVLDNGFNCYSVELNKEVAEKLSEIMKNKGHKKDYMIIGDWLDMLSSNFEKRLPNLEANQKRRNANQKKNFLNSFDIVLGDASFMNLATREDNEKLAKILSKVIVKGGYFVTRQVIWADEFKTMQKLKLIEAFRKKEISWQDLLMELRFWTYKKECFNNKTYQYDAKKNFELIDADFKKGLFNEKEHNLLITFRNNIINTIYPEKEFISLLETNHFECINQFIDDKFKYCSYLKMFVFEKK